MVSDRPLSNDTTTLGERQAVANRRERKPLPAYLGFSNIRQEESEQSLSYHSLQAALRLEERHGFSAQLSYTYSHEIDIQSSDLTIGRSDAEPKAHHEVVANRVGRFSSMALRGLYCCG